MLTSARVPAVWWQVPMIALRAVNHAQAVIGDHLNHPMSSDQHPQSN